MSHPPDLLERLREALAGRYTIERELGRGGMATVYLADDLKHGRKVALKLLRPELSSVLGPERFSREIRVAAGLSHPHVLPVHDSGEVAGLLFYVMPYVRGESLRQKLDREKTLSVEEAIGIVRQVAAALDHAHAQGLIHRDIKPENILLHEGVAVVADFGIAIGATPADRLTGTGMIVGTPEYMSPEQAAGERTLDGRSDIYSLGCVLYEMLTGEPPFTGPSAQAVFAKRFTDPIPSVRRLRPAIPPEVEGAVTRALARDPADRLPSGAALVEALTHPDEHASRAQHRSVAVLPFLNFSADPENEFFADGITEDVIAQLSRIRALKVISRTSVMPFKGREQNLKEIAARLKVSTLLEGSVRRAGSRVRIVAQLIDAESEDHLWAETYDRDLTDIFAIQSDVALQIASALKAELSPEEHARIRQQPTDNLHAYQLYLLAKHCMSRWTEEGIDQALKHLEQAIALDPGYALAYANVGFAYLEVGIGVAGTLPHDEAFRRSRAAVDKALELDPNLAEAHAVLAQLMYVCDYNWTGAEREFRRAIELNPNSGLSYDAYGLLLSALERYDDAIEIQRRANELDPLAHRLDVATTMVRMGRYDEAEATVTRILEYDPHFAMAHATLGWIHIFKDKYEPGLAELQKAMSLAPESTLYRAQFAQALARAGKTEEAREQLQRLEGLAAHRYVSPYHLAYGYTGLGEFDRAMELLEQACAQRAGGIFGVKGSFLFAPLRSHPRFQALLQRMNLA